MCWHLDHLHTRQAGFRWDAVDQSDLLTWNAHHKNILKLNPFTSQHIGQIPYSP